MIPLPDKKYSIIYADPPWSYQNRGTRAAASKHYDTMTIEDISSRPLMIPNNKNPFIVADVLTD